MRECLVPNSVSVSWRFNIFNSIQLTLTISQLSNTKTNFEFLAVRSNV